MMLKKAKNIMSVVSFSTMWNLDGMVVIGFCADDYQNLRDHIRIPFVVYDGYMDKRHRISNVTIDDFGGGVQVGTYLKNLGHKNVLCVSDNEICMDLDRYRGLCEGLERKADFLKIPFKKEERLKFYKTKAEELNTYTAIFAVSDYYALELMSFLQRRCINIPNDISIVGFDGSSECQKVFPALASVCQDTEKRAKEAIALLLKMIQDATFCDSVCLPVLLKEAESVKSLV